MQNTVKKFRQSLKFAHALYLPMSTKDCVAFFKFYLDLELFATIKRPSFYTPVFHTFDNSRSKHNKKMPHIFL